MKKILFLALITMIGLQVTAQDNDKGDKKSNEILDKLTTRTESYKTIEVEFVYKMEKTPMPVSMNKLKEHLIVEGDKYRLNIAGQTVISDGKTLWTYIADAEEVQINSLEDSEESISPNKLLSSYNEEYRSKFIKEEFTYGTTAHIIDLTPIEGKSYYKVCLIIDKEKISYWKPPFSIKTEAPIPMLFANSFPMWRCPNQLSPSIKPNSLMRM
ncbi:MAG: outer membrane lipoprotein carrier protein LolA [Bacteroidales bacterium]